MRRVVLQSSRYCFRNSARRLDRVHVRYRRVDARTSAAVHRWICSTAHVKQTTAFSLTSQPSTLCRRCTPNLVARGTCTGCIMVSFFGCCNSYLANRVVSIGRVLSVLRSCCEGHAEPAPALSMVVHDRYELCGNFRTSAQQKYSDTRGRRGQPPGGSPLAKRAVSCGTALRDTRRHGTAVRKRYAIPTCDPSAPSSQAMAGTVLHIARALQCAVSLDTRHLARLLLQHPPTAGDGPRVQIYVIEPMSFRSTVGTHRHR